MIPEYRLLHLPGKIGKKIGKVDYLIAHINDRGLPVDFAALEVQAVYISGQSIRPAFDHFVATGELLPSGRRRPDFRSSAQKRLMPQLALKLPIFRRWGKRFFVAVDAEFFSELPPMKTTSRGNAEITWLSYPVKAAQSGEYEMQDPTLHYTHWDDVQTALREGVPPERDELLASLAPLVGTNPIYET